MMTNRIPYLGLCTILNFMAISPAAADDNLCDVAMNAALMDTLVGNWDTQVLSGTLTSPNTPPYPLPGPKPVFPTVIALVEDGLVISMSAQAGDVNIALDVDTRDWSMASDGTDTAPVITESDLTTLLDCDVNSVPRLTGTAPYQQGAISSEARVYLYVLNEDQLYGALHIVAKDFHLREAISVQR